MSTFESSEKVFLKKTIVVQSHSTHVTKCVTGRQQVFVSQPTPLQPPSPPHTKKDINKKNKKKKQVVKKYFIEQKSRDNAPFYG